MGALEAVDTGCAGGVAGVTGVSGEAGEAAAGAVMGVTVTPVTLPVTASFCFLLVVPRAARVALAFAALAASCSADSGARTFGGARPKSESVWLALAYAARTRFL
jgi:hypothetical protein